MLSVRLRRSETHRCPTRPTGELELLPIEPGTAKRAGELRYDAARRGLTLSVADMLIAATALAHGAGLATGSVKHYPVPNLLVIPLPGR